MYVQGGVPVGAPAVVLARGGATMASGVDQQSSLPIAPHQQPSISTQGTTYTAPSNSRQNDEATLPQNLFDELPIDEQSPPSPPKQRGLENDNPPVPTSVASTPSEPPQLSEPLERPESQEAPQDPQSSSQPSTSTETQSIVPADPTQRSTTNVEATSAQSTSDVQEPQQRPQVEAAPGVSDPELARPSTVDQSNGSQEHDQSQASFPADPPVANQAAESSSSETAAQQEQMDPHNPQMAPQQVPASVDQNFAPRLQREPAEPSTNQSVPVQQNVRASPDEEIWFDVGIIKGTSCVVTHYFLHGDQSLESTYGVSCGLLQQFLLLTAF
ncbi:hypothetical protein ANCDUO_01290 [Ancylostoma duodenale]|uniref:Uncharacterized protein n=1 Tax=Ancylostoma duodenale TaxID=51022 RepID=A0A0C2HFM8_9BILA|nr:hypothetical protein ANCDUO_01290 [Ancylostoma duodenale]